MTTSAVVNAGDSLYNVGASLQPQASRHNVAERDRAGALVSRSLPFIGNLVSAVTALCTFGARGFFVVWLAPFAEKERTRPRGLHEGALASRR